MKMKMMFQIFSKSIRVVDLYNNRDACVCVFVCVCVRCWTETRSVTPPLHPILPDRIDQIEIANIAS